MVKKVCKAFKWLAVITLLLSYTDYTVPLTNLPNFLISFAFRYTGGESELGLVREHLRYSEVPVHDVLLHHVT